MPDTRDDFIDSLADQLGIERLSEADIEALLALAATAAHGTGDRTSAPLSTFIAGVAAAGAEKRADVLDRVRRQAGAITGAQGGKTT